MRVNLTNVFANEALVVGQYAQETIPQYMPVFDASVTEEVAVVTATPIPFDSEGESALPVVITATPIQAEVNYAPVVVAYTSIEPDTLIDDSMLVEVLWPVESHLTNVFANESLVVGQYAQETIPQYMPVFDASVVQIQPSIALPCAHWNTDP